jgi:hypothetical protein
MKMRLRMLWQILAPAVGFVGCTTDMGIEPDTGAGRGTIAVWEKNGLQAGIYLDYRPTGTVTPHTFENIPAGDHTIHLFYKNYASVNGVGTVTVSEKTTAEAEFELQKSPSGSCVIETEPAGAMVSLNHVDFGTSPLTLEGLPAGSYTLGVRQGNLRGADTTIVISPAESPRIRRTLSPVRSAVIEYFSNTSCAPCLPVGEALERLMEGLPQYKDRLSLIAYHVNYPDINDPFYLYAKDDQESRIAFYTVTCAPKVLMNGMRIMYSNETDLSFELKTRIENEMALPATVELSLGGVSSTQDRVSGTVGVKGAVSSQRLFVALIEEFIGYPSPVGANKQRLFHDIFRGFAPEANGIEVAGSDTTVRFSLSYPYKDTLNSYAIHAFVQDSATSGIVQSQRFTIGK